jgi:excisionase family DNA binding protein
MRLVTPAQVAAHPGVSKALVYQWVEEGRLPAYRLGTGGRRGRILIDEVDLGAFLAGCRSGAQAAHPAVRFTHRRP